MKKKQLIELIGIRLTERYSMEDKNRFHPEVISLNTGRLYNQMITDLALKMPNSLDVYTKLFKNVEVALDTDTNLYYSILPVDISPIIDPKSGIRNIHPMIGDYISFAPITRGQRTLITGSLLSSISTKIGYTVGKNENNELIVDYFNMTSDNDVSEVRMYLVIPFEAYEDEDDIHLPGGQDMKFMESVINYMLGTPPKDLKNNNATIKE